MNSTGQTFALSSARSAAGLPAWVCAPGTQHFSLEEAFTSQGLQPKPARMYNPQWVKMLVRSGKLSTSGAMPFYYMGSRVTVGTVKWKYFLLTRTHCISLITCWRLFLCQCPFHPAAPKNTFSFLFLLKLFLSLNETRTDGLKYFPLTS